MKILKAFLWVFIVILLTACMNTSTEATPTNTSTLAQTSNPTPLLETEPPSASPTPLTLTPTPTQTPIIYPAFVEALRMAYTIDYDLYLQDGGNFPIQLTTGETWIRSPVFSDDGEKIVFLRGSIPQDLYSINPDESQEQLLVSGSVLNSLGLGYDDLSEIRDFAFIPGTHPVIFNTRELTERDIQRKDWQRLGAENKGDLLLVDTDTGTISRILEPGRCEHFYIAPTGDMIAIQRPANIYLVDLNGETIRESLIRYTPTRPYELFPDIFWAEDAAELIVTLPIGTEYDMEGPELRTAWRIVVDGSFRTQISFDPPLMASDYTISPDGKWILYAYYYYPGITDESIVSGLYLGNLLDGSSQLIAEGVLIGYWSPDSNYFLYKDRKWFLGTPDGQSDQIDIEGRLLGWIDDRHLLLFEDYRTENITVGEIDGTMIDIPFPFTVLVYENMFTFVYINLNS